MSHFELPFWSLRLEGRKGWKIGERRRVWVGVEREESDCVKLISGNKWNVARAPWNDDFNIVTDWLTSFHIIHDSTSLPSPSPKLDKLFSKLNIFRVPAERRGNGRNKQYQDWLSFHSKLQLHPPVVAVHPVFLTFSQPKSPFVVGWFGYWPLNQSRNRSSRYLAFGIFSFILHNVGIGQKYTSRPLMLSPRRCSWQDMQLLGDIFFFVFTKFPPQPLNPIYLVGLSGSRYKSLSWWFFKAIVTQICIVVVGGMFPKWKGTRNSR